MRKFFLVVLVACAPVWAWGQRVDTTKTPRPIRKVELENVDIAPGARDGKGWLMLDKDIQLELEGAMHNLYNFKYDKAEKQFRSLRRRYPEHPLPYLLMGLSQWWKIVPTNLQTKQYDKPLFAYMDTTVRKAEVLYDQDNKNYEACFFLSAAYGFDAQLNAERKNWTQATLSSRKALRYLQESKEANGLSPEFLFGQALFNYYAVWIADNYPLLKPVLLLFPKGNRTLGLQQLRNVASNGFYTGLEAKSYLMRILYTEENNLDGALPTARYLANNYPDNAYFQRFYALLCYHQGDMVECERVSREILDKINRGYAGYEGISGRYATYFLGSIVQNSYKDATKAKDYFQRCVVFSELTGDTNSGFYISANLNLGRMAEDEKDPKAARRYYSTVVEKAEKKSAQYREAKLYLKTHKK
ncbi:tetratricopeptide repeat protein [Hymenobacter metallicola]|uniref:Tol-pal system protein YbgF n=1 Tax=Hymenobacter metallicola TaxID=2563114 RepID=A0A4Z0QBG6_9BACT|nr:tol-pal system protein YbgF [Hymenobacter metallicola]TGE27428.1 tol-pal system protein YbgF [Hymenobacter metallicola]